MRYHALRETVKLNALHSSQDNYDNRNECHEFTLLLGSLLKAMFDHEQMDLQLQLFFFDLF